MAATDVPWLGERIRAERERQGVSLRGLARSVGVSASMISQIETSKTQPSVSTLYAITSTLGISIEELFAPPAPEPVPPPTGSGPESAPSGLTSAGTEASGEGDAGPEPARAEAGADGSAGPADRVSLSGRVRPDERRLLTLDSGVTWQMLGELPGRAVDFLLITYPPGATSSSNGGLMRHPGSEFGFVVSGELVLTLGFDEIRLGPGDAISFESTRPHSYRNEGTEPAVGVWFVLERGV
jgi:transcriptional regulator with XRE-family HTH domain/quercetin dioxygenase-like cupin family protein